MKTLPYQFGWATISGFRDHSRVTESRTDRPKSTREYLLDTYKDEYTAVIWDIVYKKQFFNVLRITFIKISNTENPFRLKRLGNFDSNGNVV